MTLALVASVLMFVQAALPAQTASVWSVDFVRTKPGLRADYLEFARLNWAAVREEMQREGAVRSFLVLEESPGEHASATEWDVMLVTEYASRAAYDAREESYQRAVARLREPDQPWPRLVNGRGPRMLADILSSSVLDTFGRSK